MNLQQWRAVKEATRTGFNLTEAAETLHMSQSGISRQIRELEDELGIEIFFRHGKRLTGLTPPGETILPMIDRILMETDNLRRAGSFFFDQRAGSLSIAATHSQARYALPAVVKDFAAAYPEVKLTLHQGSPKQVAAMLISGEADIGVATEALADYDELVALPCYRWTHSVILPPGHELLQDAGPITLEQLARHPLVTYETGYTGRSHIDAAFRARGLTPTIVLAAMDADVIKTYVELGMGIGIVASIAFDPERDRTLRALDAGHLFEFNVTRLAVRSGAWLAGYVYAFIEEFAPSLTATFVKDELAARARRSVPGNDVIGRLAASVPRSRPDVAPASLAMGTASLRRAVHEPG